MQNRFTAANNLFPHLNDYWGGRIKAQLMYLEEVNNAQNAELDAILDAAFDLAAVRYKDNGNITRQSAAEIEAVLQPASKTAKSITVACVGHAHIDMNWMWGYDETVSLTVDTIRTMLAFMREYPGFTFGQSQASVYKIIEDYAPEMLPAICGFIKEGRWEVIASTWVEADKNMPSGESMARHLLYTKKYLKKLLELSDDQFRIDFEPDTFGHGANVPEILSSGGVKYYYHCRGYCGHHLYRWRAPSGKEITVFREPTWYIDEISAESFMHIPRFCADNKIDRMLRVYGVGDHGGGATRRDIERIIEYNTWPCMPEITFGSYIDFFNYIDSLDLPVVDEELNFIFDGCYTSQSRIKKANRISETKLYEAELLNTISHISGVYPYDVKIYEKLWQNTLFNHFHDILPGSGTIETREHALGLFQQTMAGAGTRLSAAARGIAANINTAALLPITKPPIDSIAEGAGVGFDIGYLAGTGGCNYTAYSAAGGKKRLFVLFNPSQSFIYTTTLLTVWDWEGDINKTIITDETGLPLEHELIHNEMQSFAFHSYFQINLRCDLPPFSYRTVLLDEDAAPKFIILCKDPRVDIPAEYILENDLIRAVFDPKNAALISLIDKSTGKEFVDAKRGGSFRYIMEDPSRGMTSWRIGRYASDTPVAEGLKITEVSGSLVRRFTYEVPVGESLLKVTVSLDKNARHLRYAVLCDWRQFGENASCGKRTIGAAGKHIPLLVFRIPLAYDCKMFTYDNAMGIVSRPALNHDVPALTFAFAPQGDGGTGIMVSSDSKYGFRCTDNSVSLSLIRSSYNPDPAPEIYTHAININVGIADGAVPGALVDAACRQIRTSVSVACAPGEGSFPLRDSFIKIINGDAVISSVKISEDGSAAILRCYDVSGSDAKILIRWFRKIKSALYVDTHENILQGSIPTVNDNDVAFDIRAYGVATVKLVF